MRKIKWNKYTWYSRIAALVFFIAVLPSWTFYLGVQYHKTTETLSESALSYQNRIRGVTTRPTISNVIVGKEGLLYGSLSISWESTRVEKVDIYFYNAADNSQTGILTLDTVNQGIFEYEIEDIDAWRDTDGPFKVVVVSSDYPSVMAESIPLRIGRPCSSDVCE